METRADQFQHLVALDDALIEVFDQIGFQRTHVGLPDDCAFLPALGTVE